MKAFSNKRYDYYRLTKPLGMKISKNENKSYIIPEGAIFFHDKDDSVKGSISNGCLKLCWTSDGSTYGLAGDSMTFHSAFKDSDLFELVQPAQDQDAERTREVTKAFQNLAHSLEELLCLIKKES